tara:strand:- start:4559 stop:4792 length:234 start_codon:yes stop_codon:yes gene_type:complete
MQINTNQIIKMLEEIDNEAIDVGLHSTCPVTDKKVGLGVKLINTPVRSERPVDNLFAMQDWAMRELCKSLKINKTKS